MMMVHDASKKSSWLNEGATRNLHRMSREVLIANTAQASGV